MTTLIIFVSESHIALAGRHNSTNDGERSLKASMDHGSSHFSWHAFGKADGGEEETICGKAQEFPHGSRRADVYEASGE